MANRKHIDPTKSAAYLYAFKLRQLREDRGWSQPRLGTEANCSGDLISKIETVAAVATLPTSRLFDKIFGITPYFEELQPLAAQDGLPGWFRPYATYENEATSIRLYDPLYIPGLFQTEAYARETMRSLQRADKLDQVVLARMARQLILGQEDPPWVYVLLAEEALRKVVGDTGVMREVYAHLLGLIKQPNIALRIVPAGASIHPGGGFTLFSFEDESDIGWVEAVAGHGHPLEQTTHVEELKVLLDMISSLALTPEASEQLICDLMEGM